MRVEIDLNATIALLREENSALKVTVAAQGALIQDLKEQVAQLSGRLKMDSSNSSKPPSTDGLSKPAPKSLRLPSNKKRGKQKGTSGHHLEAISHPDEIITLDPVNCSCCGVSLQEAEILKVEARQVFELPPQKVVVTEYRANTRRCLCGTKNKAAFPSQAIASACYGPKVRALAVFLVCGHHVPYDRAASMMSEICGLSISPGSITNMVKEAANGLGAFNNAVRDALRDARVVNFDETGARVAGSLFWVHSASTKTLTAYLVHKNRGSKAIDAMGVLTSAEIGEGNWAFDGIAVHDGWRAYRSYEVLHALCNAHHLRELKGIVEFDETQLWATKMAELLVYAKHKVQDARKAKQVGLSVPDYLDILHQYDTLVTEGFSQNPKRPGRKQTKATNLLKRLGEYRLDVLRFVSDFEVPFDNNLAERDIRMIKLQQKISGCFRTTTGAEHFCKIRSYISTARKQGQRTMDILVALFEGNCWMPANSPP